MKPPYDITPKILKLISEISEKIGEVKSGFMDKPSPRLRKQNKIKTIHNSLKIEGNTLSEQQITGLIENKRVIGPQKDIKEVLNAIDIYENLDSFDPTSEKSFLKAHRILMNELINSAGNYRNENVGIVKGDKVEHLAPPHKNVPFLMKDLFKYLKDPNELTLIKSCVFHYEMEFIHPFLDGNGRMGRLWQTLILYQEYEVFEYLPFESLISQTQDEYYRVLSECDKSGKSTLFIEYMLDVINDSLGELLNFNNNTLSQSERLKYFISKQKDEFSRKDYMNVFKNISAATASRDLKAGIDLKLFERIGELNKTIYRLKN
jgi:Fic family protein